MSRILKLSRGRVFSARDIAFNLCARAQCNTPSLKSELFGEAHDIFKVHRSLDIRAPTFHRPFSVGIDMVSLSDEAPQSKLNDENVDYEEDTPSLTLGRVEEEVVLSDAESTEEGMVVNVAPMILETCEGKLWNVEVEEALAGFSKDLNGKVVKKVLQKIHIDNLKPFFNWAGMQEGYIHGRHEYKALIRSLVRNSKFDMAMEILEEMKKKDVKILPRDFAKLVYHTGKTGKLTHAKEVVERMKSYGLKSDETVHGALLTGHLEAKVDEGVANILEDLASVKEFNAAISAFARARKPDLALKMLEAMEDKGCEPNVQTFDLLVRCLCRADRTDKALEALQNMQGKGLVPNVNIYNVLISHLCQQKEVDKAMELLSQMKGAGCHPDIVTHNSLVSGYLRSREVAKAHQHVELMKAEGCRPTRETSRLFVVNLSMSEELEKALQEFRQAAEGGKHLAIDACNCLMKGLIKAGRLDRALEVFEEMKGAADMSTFVVLLRGCCNLSRFDVIERLLGEARTKEIKLPVSTFVLLLQTYSTAKIFKKVASVYKEFQENWPSSKGPKTNTSVLEALSRGHQLDSGVEFCEHLIKSSDKINSRQLKYFLRLLIKSGRAEKASSLMKALSENGLVIAEKSQRQAA